MGMSNTRILPITIGWTGAAQTKILAQDGYPLHLYLAGLN